tara:strand:- start:409 stop:1623 length:1215 start_codon:yes stop_codon:yes gene_type:complete
MSKTKKYNKKIHKKASKKTKSLRFTKNEIIKKVNKNLKCNFLNVGMTIKKIGAGVSNYVVSGCLDNNELCKNKVAFRIMGISTHYPNNDQHPVNFEVLLYHKLNRLVDKDITPHIIYLYKSIICDFDDVLGNYTQSISQKIDTEIKKGNLEDKINILMLEFSGLGTINSFVKNRISKLIQFKILFFQVMSMLVTTQYHIPNFIHGDIHCNNIIIQRDLHGYSLEELRSGVPKYIRYRLFEKDFYIPWTGFSARVFDFDFSRCDELKNAKMNEDYVKISGITVNFNPVFDYHLFINSLLNDKNKYDHPNIPTGVFDFYNEQIPEKYQGFKNEYLGFARLTNYKQTGDINDTNLVPVDIRTPSDVLLNHPFFEVFRKKPKKFKIIKEYNSKIPHEKKVQNRKDMFK